MNDSKNTMEPWQLILILVIVVSFFGGLYLTNQSISAKLDSVEANVKATKETLKMKIEGLDNRLDMMMAKHAAAGPPVAAPAPAPVAVPAPAPAEKPAP